MSGRRLALAVVIAAAAIAGLRTILVPVGSFRAGLDQVRFGMTADEVRRILGDPNRVCTTSMVEHVELRGDNAAMRGALREATAERWVYSRSRPPSVSPRDASIDCRAPVLATELGFDPDRRLRWYVREMQQTPATVDPDLAAGANERR